MITTGRSILFPYGVLEIKLAGDAPSWIDALLTDFQSSAVQVVYECNFESYHFHVKVGFD